MLSGLLATYNRSNLMTPQRDVESTPYHSKDDQQKTGVYSFCCYQRGSRMSRKQTGGIMPPSLRGVGARILSIPRGGSHDIPRLCLQIKVSRVTPFASSVSFVASHWFLITSNTWL